MDGGWTRSNLAFLLAQGSPVRSPRMPRTPTEGPADVRCQGESWPPEKREPHVGGASSLGPGVGLLKALDSEKDTAQESGKGVRASPPLRTGGGRGSRLEEGLPAEPFELAKLVALRGGSTPAPSRGPWRERGLGPTVAFSVPGPEEAQFTIVEGLVSAPSRALCV